MDRFPEAVSKFIALVDYYEKTSRARGDDEVGGDLRKEAVQYTAISLVDDKWGSLAKAKETFQSLGGRPYEAEIYRRMGDLWFDQTSTRTPSWLTRCSWRRSNLQGRPAGPAAHSRVPRARPQLDEAFSESEKLAQMFGPGTKWHEKHRDPDAVAQAQESPRRAH